MKTKSILYICFLIPILLISCKSANNEDLEFPESFRGVIWEYYEEGQDSSDFFIDFAKDEVFFYDYFGGDCYYSSKETLVEKNGEKYTLEEIYDGEIVGSSGYLKRVGDELWVSGVKSYQTKQIYKISNRTINSFTPECEDFSAKTRTRKQFRSISK